jgi:hypothetical protein
MIFVLSSINQPMHPELVPFDLNLVPIRPRGLLAHTVIACSDSYEPECTLASRDNTHAATVIL